MGIESAMVSASAFCHVFRHRGRHVVYDVPTNRLLAVDPVLAAVLPLYRPLRRAELNDRLGSQFSRAAIDAAVAEIEDGRRREGLFRTDRPQSTPPVWTAADDHALACCRRQLILAVSEDCNLRCRYCPLGAKLATRRSRRPLRMPREIALAAVDDFLAASAETEAPIISFYGGEPLLALDLLLDLVTEVRRRPGGERVRFCLDTNGLGLSDPRAADMIRRERMFVQVSIDGPAGLHDRLRRTARGGPSHARIEANLAGLLRADPTLAGRLSVIATLTSPCDLAAVGEYFADFPPFRAAGIDQPVCLRVNRARHLERAAAADRKVHWGAERSQADDAAQWRRQLLALRERYLAWRTDKTLDAWHPFLQALFEDPLIAWYHRDGNPLSAAARLGGCCLPGVRRLYVGSNGTLAACERIGGQWPLGTVAAGIDVRRIQALRERFAAAIGDRCRNCWAVRLCNVCYTCLEPESGALPAGVCEGVRRGLEATLRLLLDLKSRNSRSLQWLVETSVT
jgi:uncharacterized protein